MKITDIRITSFTVERLKKPFWNAIKTTRTRSFGRIEVYTDEGIIGTAPVGGSVRKTVEGMKNFLIGMDPMRHEQVWDRMYMGGSRKPVTKGTDLFGISAVDIALWDIKGQALEQPVWKLLGGAQEKVWAYAAGGYYQDGKGIRELCAEMEEYVTRGYTAVKMKVGWPGISLKDDIARVRAVRETVGPDVALMLDANNAWEYKTALRFCREAEPFDPYWIEEPVHADDLEGGRRLSECLDMPVASGENEFTRWGFRDLIENRAADVIQADPRICGGISEWIKIAGMASAHHRTMAPHGNANIGSTCVAAVGNGLITENYLREFSQEFIEPVEFREGFIIMNEQPGLGFIWDEEGIRRHQQKSES